MERLSLALTGTHRHAYRRSAALHAGAQRPTAFPSEQLVGPLVVIDIRSRAAAEADAQLTPDDLKSWERKHGRMPDGAVVALSSGWDARVGDERKFFGLDDKGGFHFPGFHLEAVQFLHEQRNIKGIATDTLSLDPGKSGDFSSASTIGSATGKWGLENVAGLGRLPPHGATIVVGAPKIAGCTGGPSRVLALIRKPLAGHGVITKKSNSEYPAGAGGVAVIAARPRRCIRGGRESLVAYIRTYRAVFVRKLLVIQHRHDEPVVDV